VGEVAEAVPERLDHFDKQVDGLGGPLEPPPVVCQASISASQARTVRGDLMHRIRLATAGLFVAWIAHDLEELATMRDTSRTLVRRLPNWMPLPAPVRRQGVTARHVATAIPAVGLVAAAASVCGYRTQGRSAFDQNALLALACTGSATSVRAFWQEATPVVSLPLRRSSSHSGCGQPGLSSKPAFPTDAAFRPRPRWSPDPSPAPISPPTTSPRTSPEDREALT
jgi:hypothetical protein